MPVAATDRVFRKDIAYASQIDMLVADVRRVDLDFTLAAPARALRNGSRAARVPVGSPDRRERPAVVGAAPRGTACGKSVDWARIASARPARDGPR
jgi:hypothetical protein